MKKIFLIATLTACIQSYSQTTGYTDSIQSYLDGYVREHEVVTGDDKKYLQFFPIDESYKITAKFEKTINPSWFNMEAAGNKKKLYRVYGTVSFTINNTPLKLNIYQSQSLMEDPQYQNYLLLLFTDLTSGKESYEGGRYLDFTISDIKDDQLIIDFNKAYNPYCAYEKNKYNCPVPPKENNLPIAIRAGEKLYLKKTN